MPPKRILVYQHGVECTYILKSQKRKWDTLTNPHCQIVKFSIVGQICKVFQVQKFTLKTGHLSVGEKSTWFIDSNI